MLTYCGGAQRKVSEAESAAKGELKSRLLESF